jgi:hypothetical protein
MGGSNWRPGTEISKVIDEIHKARIEASPVTLTFKMIITFEELRALREHIDGFIADRLTPDIADDERVLVDAMEALAAALPRPPR